MTARGYKLDKHDIFTIEWINEKYLLGMPLIIHKVYYHRIWYRYKIEYIGNNMKWN